MGLTDRDGTSWKLAIAASVATVGAINSARRLIARGIANIPLGIHGEQILGHWFSGKGEDLIIQNDPEWDAYLLANDDFKAAITSRAEKAIRFGLYEFSADNAHISLTTTSKEGKGGYFTGYALINGTNKDYGGFCLKGNIVPHENGYYTVKAYYVLNDRVDPNMDMLDDRLLSPIGRMLGGVDYTLQISGAVEFCMQYK